MSIRRLIRVFAVCGLLPALMSQGASADPPEGVVRMFAVVTGLHTDSDLLPYFLGDESLGVVVAPRDQSLSNSLQFIPDDEADPRVDGTTWVFQDATHITTGPDGDSVTGTFLWLLSPDTLEGPPLGALTFTGPDSPCILNQRVLYRRLCENGDCGYDSGNDGKYVTTSREFADDVIVVVTAVFSR